MKNTMQATLPEKIGDCSRFLEKGDFPYHATLYVDDQIIHCSGLVLSYWSTVLETELEIDSAILLESFGFEGCIEAVKDCVKILHGGEITISMKNTKTILKFSLIFDIQMLRKLVLSWVKRLELTEIEELEFTLDLAIQWKKLRLVYNQKDQGDIILDLISENCNRRHSCHHFLSLLGENLEQSNIILDMIFNFKIHILSHELNSLNSELMRYINCETRALQVLDLIVDCDDNRLEIADNLFDHLYDHICNINGERLKKIARFHQTMLIQKDENKNNYVKSPCSSSDNVKGNSQSDTERERSNCATKANKVTKKQENILHTNNDLSGQCGSKHFNSNIPSRKSSKNSHKKRLEYVNYIDTRNLYQSLEAYEINVIIRKYDGFKMSSFMSYCDTIVQYHRLEIFLTWYSKKGRYIKLPDENMRYIQKNLDSLNVSLLPKNYIDHINKYIYHGMKLKDVTLDDYENQSNLTCQKFELADDHRRQIGAGNKRASLFLPNTQRKVLFALRDNLPCYVLTDPKLLKCENKQIPVYHWFIRYMERSKRRGPMNFLSLVTTGLDTVLSIISDIERFSVHLFGFIEK